MWLIKRLSKSTLVRGSILIFTASQAVSFANFLFNLLMGRMLGVEKYGELGAILSLVVLVSAPLTVLNLLVVKTVSYYWGKKEKGTISIFIEYLTRKLFILGAFAGLILFLLNPFILDFLKLDSFLPIFLISISYVFSGPITLNRAALQGMLSFSKVVVNSLTEVSLKLIISVILVFLGLKVVGAMLGMLAASLVAYILTLLQLKVVVNKHQGGEFPKKYFLSSLIPVFITSFTLSAFFSIDILLVRHFFPPTTSGEYVAVSTAGKIIFYAVGPMIAVMFPVISSRVGMGTSHILPLLGTLVLSLTMSVVMIFIYFFIPKFITNILFGSSYIGIIPYLGLFSFYMAIYTINSILTHFLLSTSYYRPITFLSLIALLQAVGISFFHNSLFEVIWVNITVSLIYCVTICLFIYSREKNILLELFLKVMPRRIYAR